MILKAKQLSLFSPVEAAAAPYAAETILRQILVRADQKVSRAAFRGSLFVDGDGAPKARDLGRVPINRSCRPEALSMSALEDEADIPDPRSNVR